MQGKQTAVEHRRPPVPVLTQVPAQSGRTLLSAFTEQRRCVVVVGSVADIPRALQHPAVVEGRFRVSAALGLDREDGTQEDEGVDALLDVVSRERIDSILVAGPVGAIAMRRIADLAVLHNCEVLAVMPTEVLSDQEPSVVWSGRSPLIRLSRDRTGWQLAVKRAFDVSIATLGLVVAAPLLLFLAVLISLESPGAPLFRHERIGRGGRRFGCLKLRTMRMDAEECLRCDPSMYEEYRNNHYKIPEDRDPRVTTLGAFLRRTSLDELPQLLNVLRGEMSLVGPRPVVEEELAMYGESAPVFLSMRPGITGRWAVNGRHGVGYPVRCEMELDYVREWSLVGDLAILGRTVRAVARY